MKPLTTFITGSSDQPREPNDFYKTPPRVTKAILDREVFDGVVWEPACGDGAISQLLAGSCTKVISSDLHNRGFGQTGINFLQTKWECDHVITNPPYSLAQRFVEHALTCATVKVAMLLKLNFLEGQGRKPFFARTPLRTVYVFSYRISFDKGNETGKGAGLLAYAWYVWEHGYRGRPQIEWI